MHNDQPIAGPSLAEQATTAELVQQLAARVAHLEAQLAAANSARAASETVASEPSVDVPTRRTGPTDRRAFLRLAGVAATGLAASTVFADRAAAADNSAILQGQANNSGNTATTTTTITNNGASDVANAGFKGVGPSNSNGLWGVSNGSLGAGVLGSSDIGYGVLGLSSNGYDLYAGGIGRIGMGRHLATGTPTVGGYAMGDIFRNDDGELYVCVVGGTVPTAKFRKVAGPTAAGALHVVAPIRAYDSRPSVLTSGSSRVVPITNGTTIPTGAVAIAATLTITNTTGSSGWLTITAGDVGSTSASSINWFGAGQNLACTVITALDSLGRVKVFNNSSNNADFIIDVTGYYL